MWKYIIIAAVVLFLGACFLFYKNNEALTGPEGEVAAFQAQFDMAKKKALDIEKDKAIKRYAELRTEYFKQLSEKANSERAAIEAEDAPFDQEIGKANSDMENFNNLFKEYESRIQTFQKDAAKAVSDDESGDAVTDGDMETIGQRIAGLVEANNALEAECAAEEKMTSDLGAETQRTIAMIEAAKKVATDRMARLSPADLKCTVLSTDPTWDYVILDGGINKGIIIGSSLAVMRGGQKVCELVVTLVEGEKSSCDVVYSTMRPGDKVRPGDTVVSVRNN